MHDAPSMRHLRMNPGMKIPGSWIRSVRLRERRRIVCIEQQQLAGLDLREVSPARVHQKLAPVLRHRDTEVVGDRLSHAEARKPTEGGSQVDAFAFKIGK